MSPLLLDLAVETHVHLFQAVTERKEMFRSLSCMTLEWYAHKFPKGLPLHPSDSKFYQPDYHPLLPVYQSRVRQVGEQIFEVFLVF